MRIEEIKLIMDNIIENEYYNIVENKEFKWCNSDEEFKNIKVMYSDLFTMLGNILTSDCKNELFDKLDSVVGNMIDYMQVFYFKEGVKAGATKLNFIKEIDGVNIESVI